MYYIYLCFKIFEYIAVKTYSLEFGILEWALELPVTVRAPLPVVMPMHSKQSILIFKITPHVMTAIYYFSKNIPSQYVNLEFGAEADFGKFTALIDARHNIY